jgi:hypothetical protein
MVIPVKSSAANKVVIVFRTCGHLEADGQTWALPIHGWVFEPQCRGGVQRATLALFRRYLRYKTKLKSNELFQERTQAFFVGNQKGLRLQIQLNGHHFLTEKTGANGHAKGLVRISRDELSSAFPKPTEGHGWVDFQVTLPHVEKVFPGRALCLPAAGLSIISDIDDTIKDSHVRNRKELLTNTFLRNFRPIPTISKLYQNWSQLGAEFHYVSSSPWQLHDPLTEFLAQEGFPEGSLHLRSFSLRNSRLLSPFVFRPENKARSIRNLLQQFPHRRFILIGDSGERDPEIYGEAARRFPQQVQRIFIRDITGQGPQHTRYARSFRGTPAKHWRIYQHAEELSDEPISSLLPIKTS